MLKDLTGCILKIYPYRTLLKGYENFCTPPENMKCASYLTLHIIVVSPNGRTKIIVVVDENFLFMRID